MKVPTALPGALHESVTCLKDWVRAESRLASTELRRSVKTKGKSSIRITIYSCLAALGILPFLSFLVIGLGVLLHSNFWLSSLLVSILIFTLGGVLVYLEYEPRVDQPNPGESHE